jgi:NAD(P)-dependent dehydrogenase (short-subunit alcohol dehydrogenase family)
LKRVLITGASSGIGLQLAKDYEVNHQVIACGRDGEKLQRELGDTSCQLLCFDVADRASVLAACADLPDLDLVILNAGTCEYIDDVLQFDGELFERVIRANLIGTGYCLEALMGKIRRGGRLALMSSTATYLPFSRAQAYGASKAGIDYLAASLAVDALKHEINVSNIKPCFVDTPLTQRNNFDMPGRINVQQASDYIRRGLEKGKHNIAFTPMFVFGLKLLQLLPFRLWAKLQSQQEENA